MGPFGRCVSCFLAKLSPGAIKGRLPRVEFSSWKFNHDPTKRVPELPLKHQIQIASRVVKQGHHHDGAWMNHIFSECRTTVRQFYGIPQGMKKVTLKQFGTVDFGLLKMPHV